MEKSHFLRYTHTHLRLLYNKDKRERYGVKFYMLCKIASAYLYSFKVYYGSGTTYPEPNGIEPPKPYEEYSTYSNVVLSLMDGLYGDGYCVTLDNLYTEPYLLLALYVNNTDCFDTLRKKAQYYDKKLMILRWNDCYKTKKQDDCFHDVHTSCRRIG